MIRNIIFDFGGIFIDLDKNATARELQKMGRSEFSEEMLQKNLNYEKGYVSTIDFLQFYQEQFPDLPLDKFIDSWCAPLADFPIKRLKFLQKLSDSGRFKLVLLSNTNDLHISWIKENIPFFDDFKRCFDRFNLSHKLHLRKPDIDLFKFVLEESNLHPPETIFIDDTLENIRAAERFNMHTWHLDPDTEEVTDLFEIKKELFDF